MEVKKGVMMTRQGLNVLSAALAGERIVFSRVSIGDGVLDVSSSEEYGEKVLSMTDIINWRMDIPIVEAKNLGNGYMRLHVRKDNAEVAEGFFARERAVYAIDQDSNQEILYCYINTGDNSSYIPSNTGAIKKIIDFSIYTIIQNAETVEVNLDASFAYVSLQDYEEHVKSSHPHLNTPNHYLDVADTTAFWAVDNDNHLHQISVSNAKRVILGDMAIETANLSATISDSKSKIDELDLFTNAKNELGLDANLLVVEDFNPATEIDTFKVKVMSCARGGKLIGVESDSDILVGQEYWIADGINQEVVQVEGVSYSTDYYHISLKNGLSYDYNLDRAYLYRSTVTSKIPTVERKSVSWTASQPFVGIEANVVRTLEMDLNAFALDISGEGVVIDDYFTLWTE